MGRGARDRLEQTRDSNKVDRRGLNRCEGVRTPRDLFGGEKSGCLVPPPRCSGLWAPGLETKETKDHAVFLHRVVGFRVEG